MKGAQFAIKIIDSNTKYLWKIPSASELMHRKKSVKANMPQEMTIWEMLRQFCPVPSAH